MLCTPKLSQLWRNFAIFFLISYHKILSWLHNLRRVCCRKNQTFQNPWSCHVKKTFYKISIWYNLYYLSRKHGSMMFLAQKQKIAFKWHQLELKMHHLAFEIKSVWNLNCLFSLTHPTNVWLHSPKLAYWCFEIQPNNYKRLLFINYVFKYHI